jgi:hypothetical protein
LLKAFLAEERAGAIEAKDHVLYVRRLALWSVRVLLNHRRAGSVGNRLGYIGHVGGSQFAAVVFEQVTHDGSGVLVGLLMGKRARQVRGGAAGCNPGIFLKRTQGGSSFAILIKVPREHHLAPGRLVDL